MVMVYMSGGFTLVIFIKSQRQILPTAALTIPIPGIGSFNEL